MMVRVPVDIWFSTKVYVIAPPTNIFVFSPGHVRVSRVRVSRVRSMTKHQNFVGNMGTMGCMRCLGRTV
jgi:hypothetical protein